MLTDPAPREALHNRDIALKGYRRADGLFDIEGALRDTKNYDFTNRVRGTIKAGDSIHDMRVRITINENLEIVAAEATTIAGPYAICPEATRVFARLVGITIGPGWRRKLRNAIGGVEGCTHITELMGPVATVAYQTLFGERARQAREAGEVMGGDSDLLPLRNTCLGHAEDSGAVLAGNLPQK